MLFNSFSFVTLVVITFILYYLPVFRRIQTLILIIASLVFYAFNQLHLLTILALSVGINILSSYAVTYTSAKKVAAVAGVVGNLSILLFFKYSPLIGRTFFEPATDLGQFLVTIPLPIGISFFTFQGISLVVDVYKGKLPADQIPVSFVEHARRILFFKSFFPQLVSGPIVKAHDFLPQIGPKTIQQIDWNFCYRKLVMGYFLKMVVADNLKNFTFFIEYPHFEALSRGTLLVMLVGYSFQIFADFAGYSLIAIGLAKLFGYDFPINFNFPYISTSLAEFWRRWHISLSSFLREYLYIPLGGNRKGRFRMYGNLFLTMLLGGLWHGAAWSYAVWGAFHGGALVIERMLMPDEPNQPSFFRRFVGMILVFGIVTAGWLLFKLPNFTHVLAFIRTIIEGKSQVFSDAFVLFIVLYSAPVVLYHAAYLGLQRSSRMRQVFKRTEFIWYGILFFMILVNSGPAGDFIYFQF